MRKIALCAVVLGAMVAVGCDDPKTTAPTTSGSGSAAAKSSASAPAKAATASAPTAAAADSAKPAQPKQTPLEMHTSIAKRMAEYLNAHDAKKLASLYAETAVTQEMGQPEVRGRASIEQNAEEMFKMMKDVKLTTGRHWINKNQAVLEWTFTGRVDGDFMGMKVANKSVGVVGVDVVTVGDDGLITEDRRYSDGMTVLGQIDPKLAGGGPVRAVPTAPPGTEVLESKGTPEEAKLVDAANKMYGLMDEHKVDDVLAMSADDVTMDDFTQAGTMKGKKDIKAFLGAIFTALPDFKQPRTLQFAAGDFVITQGTITGTQKGALGPIKASNKPVTFHFVDVMQMKDGKFTKGWSYANNAELLQQIGAIPAHGATPPAASAPAPAPSGKTAPLPAGKPTPPSHSP